MCKGLAALPATCLKSAKDIKHKIGFLLHKPEAQVTDLKQTEHTDTAIHRTVAAFEVKKWKESFANLMNSEDGRAVFTSFLKMEFSEENIEFWNACQEFKKTSPDEMAAKAQLIYQQYVEPDSPKEVNLDAETREETRNNLANVCLSCFDEAQKKIYTLMEKDSYRRFLNSKLICSLSHIPVKAGFEKDKNRLALISGT